MALSVYSQVPIVDANGDPYVDAYLYFGIPNLDPVANPKTVYDQDGNIIANPVRTNVNGLTTLAVDLDGEYSLIIKNSALVQILSIPEGVYGIGAGGGGGSSTNYWEAVTDSGTGTTVIRIDKGQASYAVFDYPDVLIGTNTSNIPLFQNKGGSTWAINENFIISVSSSVAEPFEVKTSFNGIVNNDFVTTGIAATNILRQICTGANLMQFQHLGAGGATLAFEIRSNLSGFSIRNYSYVPWSVDYTNNNRHLWKSADTVSPYTFESPDTTVVGIVHPKNGFGVDFRSSSQARLVSGGATSVTLATDSGGTTLEHYQAAHTGAQISDDPRYSGTLVPEKKIRATLVFTAASTTGAPTTVEATGNISVAYSGTAGRWTITVTGLPSYYNGNGGKVCVVASGQETTASLRGCGALQSTKACSGGTFTCDIAMRDAAGASFPGEGCNVLVSY